MWSMIGVWSGKVRSTPTPKEILRTVKVSPMPPPWRRMTTPWKTWTRERVPSTTLTWTLSVSPARKAGMSSRSDALSISSNFCMMLHFPGRHRSPGRYVRVRPVRPRGPPGRALVGPDSPCGRGHRVRTQGSSLPEHAAYLKSAGPRARCPSTRPAYGGAVDISPGWPVALALVVLLAVTVVANRLGAHRPRPRGRRGRRARVVQLGLVALVITAVVARSGSRCWRSASCSPSAA